jgi:hypothetical protein
VSLHIIIVYTTGGGGRVSHAENAGDNGMWDENAKRLQTKALGEAKAALIKTITLINEQVPACSSLSSTPLHLSL